MKIASIIKSRIEAVPDERIITYEDFKDLGGFQAVAMALSRLRKEGVIQRLSKGLYYKPKKTKFGTLAPSDNEILRSVLSKGGYIAGPVAMNRLGVTTQIPNEILIAGSKSNRKLQLGNLRLKFVKGMTPTGAVSDLAIFNLFEALRLLKKTPDGQIVRTIGLLKSAIKKLSFKNTSELAQLCMNSRPSTRAVLGAILEDLELYPNIQLQLKDSLNPISIYKLCIPSTAIKSKNKWRIK